MKRAADLIAEKIREKKPIRIIGDYDIDGVTATYILLTGLKDLGADADVRIPDRIADGYGLNEHLVQFAADEGRDTIVTCDNGIAASSQIRLAKELGMTVVVTDHHEVPFEEPLHPAAGGRGCQSETERLFLSVSGPLRCGRCMETDPDDGGKSRYSKGAQLPLSGICRHCDDR